ncbi:MAG: hypothetical protein ACRC06_06200 [Waterburya sp.]
MGIPVKKEYFLNLLESLEIMKEIVESMGNSQLKHEAIALVNDLELNGHQLEKYNALKEILAQWLLDGQPQTYQR